MISLNMQLSMIAADIIVQNTGMISANFRFSGVFEISALNIHLGLFTTESTLGTATGISR
jgi:hypothetical protein